MKSALNCLLAASQTVRPRVRRPSVHLAGNLGSLARAAAAAAFPFQLHSASLSLWRSLDSHRSLSTFQRRVGAAERRRGAKICFTRTGENMHAQGCREDDHVGVIRTIHTGICVLGLLEGTIHRSLFFLHFLCGSGRDQHETADTDFIKGGGREPFPRRRPTRD